MPLPLVQVTSERADDLGPGAWRFTFTCSHGSTTRTYMPSVDGSRTRFFLAARGQHGRECKCLCNEGIAKTWGEAEDKWP